MRTREGEKALYAEAYKLPDYRMGVRRKAFVRSVLQNLQVGSLLDVVAGRGETVQMAQDVGFDAHGTEVVESLLSERIVYAEGHALPFADGAFDHVTCWDVLEHLVPEDVEPTLRELYRVARKTVTVSASEEPDTAWLGVDLHPSRRPAKEWEDLMRKCWGDVKRIGNAGRSPAFQVVK